ncbi:hypothetical protein KBZ33_21015 [Cyanobium sp. Cruz-8D1]|uniref:hypothetical protein n=1 Tax=Cyanobium sp. Cruz-8D1 TaxID=2823711 RepID=UPI0020CCDA00|nr:hypothetical protein [Cyanobium sp. Cruz-8D1]MCP9868725.1 hypothetical protein [Cyanobium sp. Cruz-8D1]
MQEIHRQLSMAVDQDLFHPLEIAVRLGLIPIRPRRSLVLVTVVWADDTSSEVNATSLKRHRL